MILEVPHFRQVCFCWKALMPLRSQGPTHSGRHLGACSQRSCCSLFRCAASILGSGRGGGAEGRKTAIRAGAKILRSCKLML